MDSYRVVFFSVLYRGNDKFLKFYRVSWNNAISSHLVVLAWSDMFVCFIVFRKDFPDMYSHKIDSTLRKHAVISRISVKKLVSLYETIFMQN